MAKVVVIGGANVDVKGRAAAPYIAGTSNPGSVITAAGGVGRNIAHNLALLGVGTALISVVGDDAYGRLVLDETAKAGVDISRVRTVSASTGVYLAILDETGEMHAAISDMSSLRQLSLSAADERAIRDADFIVADCNLETDLLRWLMDFCTVHNRRLLIEPVSVPKIIKLRRIAWPKAFAITPNLDQLRALTRETEVEPAVRALHAMGFANVIVHCGRDGVFVSGAGCPLQAIAPIKGGNVSDVTGAGDAAVAGLICGLLDGLDLAHAARLGQTAAAWKIASSASALSSPSRAKLYELAGLG